MRFCDVRWKDEKHKCLLLTEHEVYIDEWFWNIRLEVQRHGDDPPHRGARSWAALRICHEWDDEDDRSYTYFDADSAAGLMRMLRQDLAELRDLPGRQLFFQADGFATRLNEPVLIGTFATRADDGLA